jgi:hypothetical protein
MQDRTWVVRHISTVREFFGRIIYLSVLKIKTLLAISLSTAATLLIFKRLLFKTKNNRIHEPPNDIEPHSAPLKLRGSEQVLSCIFKEIF